MTVCSIDSCGKQASSRGWCPAHYSRYRRYGSPTGGPAPLPTPLERFESRVSRQFGGCWHWTGNHDRDGYALLSVERRPYRAHRFSYEAHVGPIPDGLVIDHLCENRGCVNPEHLEPVTNAVNVRRGDLAYSNRMRGKSA